MTGWEDISAQWIEEYKVEVEELRKKIKELESMLVDLKNSPCDLCPKGTCYACSRIRAYLENKNAESGR